MKAFVVIPINYQYNDQYYYEEGFEPPTKIFLSRDKAVEEVNKLNKNFKPRLTDEEDNEYTEYFTMFETEMEE